LKPLQDPDKAELAMKTFLHLIDNKKYATAYLLTSRQFRYKVSYLQFLGIMHQKEKVINKNYKRYCSENKKFSIGVTTRKYNKPSYSGRCMISSPKDKMKYEELFNSGLDIDNRYTINSYYIRDLKTNNYSNAPLYEIDLNKITPLIDELNTTLIKTNKKEIEYSGLVIQKINKRKSVDYKYYKEFINAILLKDNSIIKKYLNNKFLKLSDFDQFLSKVTINSYKYIGHTIYSNKKLTQYFRTSLSYQLECLVDSKKMSIILTITLDDSAKKLQGIDFNTFTYNENSFYSIVDFNLIKTLWNKYK